MEEPYVFEWFEFDNYRIKTIYVLMQFIFFIIFSCILCNLIIFRSFKDHTDLRGPNQAYETYVSSRVAQLRTTKELNNSTTNAIEREFI